MKILDLGDLDGPLLIFGGPYSNLEALTALREIFRDMPPGQIICTGDVVAYCADAGACVDVMRDWGVVCVAGNCEKQLASAAPDCGCGFEQGTVCDRLSARWFAHASEHITRVHRDWMSQCPDIVTFRHAGQNAAVIHGGITDIARFIWPVSDEAVFGTEIAALNSILARHNLLQTDRIYAGHSGLPFDRRIGATRWINAGVIGMPPHDGGRETRYASIDRAGECSIKTLSYDAENACKKMILSGLDQGYHEALLRGVWPSEDVLPAAMRRL